MSIISRKIVKGDIVVIKRKKFEKISKENRELRLALKAILDGELALRNGTTRSFREFLSSEFTRNGKNK